MARVDVRKLDLNEVGDHPAEQARTCEKGEEEREVTGNEQRETRGHSRARRCEGAPKNVLDYVNHFVPEHTKSFEVKAGRGEDDREAGETCG